MADFVYNGERYSIDPATQHVSKGGVDLGVRPTDPKLQTAAAQALAKATAAVPNMADLQGRAGLDVTEPTVPAAAPRADATAAAKPKPDLTIVDTTTGVSNTPAPAKPTPGSDTLTNPLGTGNGVQQSVTGTTTPAPTTTTGGAAQRNAALIADKKAQRAQLQAQLDELNKIPVDELTSSQASLMAASNSRISALDDAIGKLSTDEPVKVLSGAVSADDEFIVYDDGLGKGPESIKIKKNDAWNGTKSTKFTTQAAGNKLFVIDQATGELKTTYGDADAAALAARNTAVSEANARVAQQNANLDDFATKARVEIEQAVADGRDAASVRAQKQLELNGIFQQWQQADGDAKRAQTQLDSYNVDRHATAKDRLGDLEYAETVRNNKATEDAARRTALLTAQTAREGTAAGMRNADVAASGTKYAADVGATTARLQAANSLLQNGMSMLAEINKTLPPGSDLAGKALEGLMQYGQKFMTGMAGPAPTMPGATSYADMIKGMPGLAEAADAGLTPGGTGIATPGAPKVTATGGIAGPANQITQQTNQYGGVSSPSYGGAGAHVPESADASAARNAAAIANANAAGQTTGAGQVGLPRTPEETMGFNQQAVAGGFTDPNAALANLYSGAPDALALAKQNAAKHSQNMAADGSLLAGAGDVKRLFGRNA